jgi:hypothetical protein
MKMGLLYSSTGGGHVTRLTHKQAGRSISSFNLKAEIADFLRSFFSPITFPPSHLRSNYTVSRCLIDTNNQLPHCPMATILPLEPPLYYQCLTLRLAKDWQLAWPMLMVCVKVLVWHSWSTELHDIGECHTRAAATINILPDDIFLEIFAFCTRSKYWNTIDNMKAWQRLVQVCRGWRQIVFASPRYLDIFLYFSNGTPIRTLSCWPEFPIFMTYTNPFDEGDVIALLKHHDRVRWVYLRILTSSQFGKVLTIMQEPFPELTHLDVSVYDRVDVPVLPHGFLGGSSPRLQLVRLSGISFPELPVPFLSSRDLVSLHLDMISTTGYISPESMVAGLAMMTRLESLRMQFPFWNSLEQRTRNLNPPIPRVVLPALNELGFSCWSEYMEDFVAQCDAPRLDYFDTLLVLRDSLWLPRLSSFVAHSETRFGRARIDFFSDRSLAIELNREFDHPLELRPPRVLMNISLERTGTHITHLTHLVDRILAMFSNVVHFSICVNDDYSSWEDDIDSMEWLTFFRQFASVRTLRISGRLAGQVSRALQDVPEEMVTEVFPSLQLLMFEDQNGPVGSIEQFFTLRRLNGRPMTVIDLEVIKLQLLFADHGGEQDHNAENGASLSLFEKFVTLLNYSYSSV